jgi:hypothetical protein
LAASTTEWRSEPDLQALLHALANSEQPRRSITLLCRLMDLPLEELEAIVEAVTNHLENHENSPEVDIHYPI